MLFNRSLLTLKALGGGGGPVNPISFHQGFDGSGPSEIPATLDINGNDTVPTLFYVGEDRTGTSWTGTGGTLSETGAMK